MKGTYITWDVLQKQNPRQTVVIVSYKGERLNHTRIFFRNWMSREEAWQWCQVNDIKRRITYLKDQSTVETNVRLLRMGKILKELEETRPKGVTAIRPC